MMKFLFQTAKIVKTFHLTAIYPLSKRKMRIFAAKFTLNGR